MAERTRRATEWPKATESSRPRTGETHRDPQGAVWHERSVRGARPVAATEERRR